MKDPYIALILHRPYCLSETFKPTAYCYEYTITDGGLKEGALVTLFQYLCGKNHVDPDPWTDFTSSQHLFVEEMIEDEYFYTTLQKMTHHTSSSCTTHHASSSRT